MPNTTDNFDIPFLDGTELVRDYPQFSEDLAEAIDAGLVSARGLIAVKSAIRTTPVVVSGIAAGGNFAVPDLSITHEVSDPTNRLIISAFFGLAGHTQTVAQVGLAINDGVGFIAVGDAGGGSQPRVSAGGRAAASSDEAVTMPSVTFVHTPGAGSKTYTVHAFNLHTATNTIFINRTQGDNNNERHPRGVSSLVIQEVAV